MQSVSQATAGAHRCSTCIICLLALSSLPLYHTGFLYFIQLFAHKPSFPGIGVEGKFTLKSFCVSGKLVLKKITTLLHSAQLR